jgi:hypothetical protein
MALDRIRWEDLQKLDIQERGKLFHDEGRIFHVLMAQQFTRVELDRLGHLATQIRFLAKSEAGMRFLRAQGVEPLVEALRAEAPGVSLVIVDPFTAITAEIVDEPRLREVSRAFVRALGAETLVLTVETERLSQQRGLYRVLSEMCGAYLVLDREATGRRTLTVEKSRAVDRKSVV